MPLVDALRLSFGTLTRFPVPPPRAVNPAVGALAMALAWVPGLALAGVAWCVYFLASFTVLPPFVIGVLVVAALAVASRALHWDGLADTIDGLGAAHSEDKALRVMAAGDVGPMGVLAIVATFAVQAMGFGVLADHAVLAGLVVVASRVVCVVPAMRGWRSARPSGLGDTVIGTLSPAVVGVCVAASVLVLGLVAPLASSPLLDYSIVAGVVAGSTVFAVSWLTCWWVARHIGGITGDVIGAGVELGTAAGLLVLMGWNTF